MKDKFYLSDLWYLFLYQIKSLVYKKPPVAWGNSKIVDSSENVVIIIAGLFEHWSFLRKIGNQMADNGYSVRIIPSIGRNLSSLPSQAKKLEQYISVNKIKNITFVTHSKGGLVALHYMLYCAQTTSVQRHIAIAVPFHGTNIGKVLRLRSVRELLPSRVNLLYGNIPETILRKTVSIYPTKDNSVWHEAGSYQGGATNIELDIVGHHKILSSRQTTASILTQLND